MIVAFDSDILILLLHESIPPPSDPETQQPVQHVRERLDQLIADLAERGARVIVPAPALAEVLVLAEEEGSELVRVIEKQAVF